MLRVVGFRNDRLPRVNLGEAQACLEVDREVDICSKEVHMLLKICLHKAEARLPLGKGEACGLKAPP